MKLTLVLSAAALLGMASAAAASPTGERVPNISAQAGAPAIQAQYYYYYYNPYYYSRYYRCEEDLGYGRRGNWGCG
jgi:hypothetical protein